MIMADDSVKLSCLSVTVIVNSVHNEAECSVRLTTGEGHNTWKQTKNGRSLEYSYQGKVTLFLGGQKLSETTMKHWKRVASVPKNLFIGM